MRNRPAILILIYCVLLVSHAQGSQTQIFESPLSKFLLHPSILDIYRDKQGILWIGTLGGLHRFDGSKLEIYTSNSAGSNWIPTADTRKITEDINGDLLVATFGGGLLKLDRPTQTFVSILNSNSGKATHLKHLHASHEGNIWIGTRDEVFLHIPNTKEFIAEPGELIPTNLQGKPLVFLEDKLGNLLVGSSIGLEEISIVDYSVSKIPIASALLPEKYAVTAMTHDPIGNLIIGTDTGHLVVLSEDKKSILAQEKLDGKSLHFISDFSIYDNLLYVATDRGLFLTDLELATFTDLSDKGDGLSNNDVFSLFADSGRIWVGTFGGIDILSFSPFELFDKKNSNISDDILAFEEDHIGRIWIGTYNGLYRYDENENSHILLEPNSDSSTAIDNRVTSIASKDEVLWLGFIQGGVKVFDPLTEQFSIPNFPQATNLSVTKILASSDEKGDIWIATLNHGLLQIMANQNYIFHEKLSLPEKRITLIFETQDGDILVTTEYRIYRYDTLADKFSLVPFNFNLDQVTPTIHSINQSKNGNIWLGTSNNGLFVWPHENQLAANFDLTNVTRDTELELSAINGIEIDSLGYIWCSTQGSLVKLGPEGSLVDRFSGHDGIQARDYTMGASFSSSTGRMYFGSLNGYNRFHPEDINIIRSSSPMRLTGIDFPRVRKDTSLDVSSFSSIELTHKDHFITFEFSVLDFIDPQSNRYQYKLEGFDPDWIDNGSRNTATYTNLPPGNYTLNIQGANSAGIWNRHGLSIAVIVLPPPWRTWWAFSIYGLLFLLALWSANRISRSYAINRKAIQLANEMHEAEDRADDDMQEQIELQDDIIQSAYQHNLGTLSLISDFVSGQEGSEHDESSRGFVAGNKKRISALAILEECLFYHAGGPAADLNKYTEMVLSKLLTHASVNPETIVTINEINATLVPAALASPLSIVIHESLENCIQHAFNEDSPANYIQLSLCSEKNEQRTGDIWTLTIRDNGMGIPKDAKNVKEGKAGLAIIESVVSKLKGSVHISNESGTTVQVTLPFDTTLENPPR